MKITIHLLLLLFVATAALAQPNTTDQLNAYLQKSANNGWSGSVLVASQGKILLENGFGDADRDAKRKETAETIFSIGSVTKQFTAAAIMKLVEAGKLSTDDPLSKFFEDAPADKAGITLHQLLTHTAGFPGAIGDDYDNLNAEQFAKLAFETPLNAVPGEAYDYSNVGYSLLGIIVERVSGMGYETFLREKLWLPAGMKRTGYLAPGFKKEELAVGYRNGERWGTAHDRPWLPDGPGWHLRANGGVLSTVGDMYRWYLALRNGSVLKKELVEKMWMPHVAEDPEGHSHYGYGWVVQQVEGRRMIWHNGGNSVYNAIMSFDPEKDLCIIASSNSNDWISDDISLQILSILEGKGEQEIPQQEPWENNPVTNAIHQILVEKGAAYFTENSDAVLRNAGFDFENDMQLLGVGKRLEEAEKWNEGVVLFEAYTRLFPNIVIAWNRLGICRKAIGDLPGAKAAWEQSLKLRPNGNPAAKWLKE
ncbi:MAG: beta-lactamase family protein [Saprospiraceae bacterium]|nr:beta-lactamase family protein [Saprospiraceae bacterium]